MTPSTDEPRVVAIVRGLTRAQRDKLLSAIWHGDFVVVECLGADLPGGLVHMVTLRWDRLTPLGLAVRAELIRQQGNSHG